MTSARRVFMVEVAGVGAAGSYRGTRGFGFIGAGGPVATMGLIVIVGGRRLRSAASRSRVIGGTGAVELVLKCDTRRRNARSGRGFYRSGCDLRRRRPAGHRFRSEFSGSGHLPDQ